jgi:hypothetical protein
MSYVIVGLTSSGAKSLGAVHLVGESSIVLMSWCLIVARVSRMCASTVSLAVLTGDAVSKSRVVSCFARFLL